MASQSTHLTANDLLNMPPSEGKFELIDGELTRMSPTGDGHGSVASEFSGFLAPFVRENRLGRSYAAETGFIISTDPDTVLAPDAAFVKADRLAGRSRNAVGFIRGAPDLAVEVISPSDTVVAVEEKVARYLEAGTSVVIVLNPARQTATVYRAPNSVEIFKQSDQLTIPDLLPGLVIPLSEVFW